MRRTLFPLFLLVAMAGCTGSTASTGDAAKTPVDAQKTQTTPADKPTDNPAEPKETNPTETKPRTETGKGEGGYREEQGLVEPAAIEVVAAPLGALPKGLPEAPKACEAYVNRKATPAAACVEPAKALEALDKALAETKQDKRDALLAGLENCQGFAPGVRRALRAELAPIECADVLVAPLVNNPVPGLDGHLYAVLRGLALAARLSRTGNTPPKFSGPSDKKHVQEFINGPMKEWMASNAVAIQELSGAASKLPGYARGVAAVEAGLAELRIVEAVRAVPIPSEIAKDQELRNIYYAELDQLLDPRKERGRDAALLGLREFAAVGVIHDARVEKVRAALSKLYGGRRIDALDGLLLPALGKRETADVTEGLAAKLPTFYTGIILPFDAVKKASVLRAMLEKGVSLPHRIALKGETLTPDMRRLYARARLELGRVYVRAVDFDQVAALLSGLPEAQRTDEDNFLLALAEALRNGPEDAAVMVRSAPVPMQGMGQTAALDGIYRAKTDKKSAFVAEAAWDSALIKQITAPIGADAAYFRDIASRYRDAAEKLSDKNQKKAAEERAKAAEETAKAIK